MADKSISELIAAVQVTPTDLFILEQSGVAKKLTGQILENWLLSFAEGHGGIQTIEKKSTSGLKDTYQITFSDTSVHEFVITNGKGISSIKKTSTSGLVDTYKITFNDNSSTTYTVTNGDKGDKGDKQYVWIKYASKKPTASSHSMGDNPDNWIGVYSGDASSAPADWTLYKWFEIKGEKGDTGATFTPALSASGDLSWTNDKGLTNPKTINIRGPVGERGPVGPKADVMYGDTPFHIIDLEQNEDNLCHYNDGSTTLLTGCSPVTKCPEYLGWTVEGDAYLYLYIGDMVDGVFVRDEKYTFCVASNNNRVNVIPPRSSMVVETEGKYFYCKKYFGADGGDINIIGCDSFREGKMESLAITPYYAATSGAIGTNADYNSVVLPTGAHFAVLRKPDVYRNTTMSVAYEANDGTVVYSEGASFGYIPDNAGVALLRIPREVDIEDIVVYTSKPVIAKANSGRCRIAKDISKDILEKFQFESQKDILWSGSGSKFLKGKRFFGIPYASRWMNSHYIGYEISAETALNALNDEYSIAYDGGLQTETTRYETVSGHTEVNSKGGTGYGIVCSTLASLAMGVAYPQTNRGFTYDRSFTLSNVTDAGAGKFMVNATLGHVVLVDEVYDEGYSVIEGTYPCAAKTVHTNGIKNPSHRAAATSKKFLDDYVYSVAHRGAAVDTTALLNCDATPVGGDIRPWRGHKAVYGPWDKSARGSSIGITIHNGATEAYMVHENGTTKTYNVTGLRYLDVSADVVLDGEYTIYSKESPNAKESFRYYSHDAVKLSFDENGKAVFSAADVEYVYAYVWGYGGDFGIDKELDYGPVVIAKGKYYPEIAADTSKIKEVYAAIVSDPDADCWGKYSCICSL